MLLGPSLSAVSGVSTHLNQLFSSSLANEFNLLHFQVGSEGRNESNVSKLGRLVFSPVQFVLKLIQWNPKIVHLNTSLEPKSYWRDVVYLWIARLMGKKIVYQVHGGALPQVFFKNNRILTIFLKRALLAADVIVLLSQEELLAYQNFVHNHRLQVIPNAIEVGVDVEWKREPSESGRSLQLVYVGRIAEVKGVFEIVKALKLLRDQGSDARLTIAGSGPDQARLLTFVKDCHLDARVSFVGAVYGEEKDRIWKEADLFVFPTYHREGLPYAILESMAARTPPVVSPVGAIPDVIEDGVHGVFVPARNPEALVEAIGRLNNNRQLICQMGEACRRRIENYYTADRLANDFRILYYSVMK